MPWQNMPILKPWDDSSLIRKGGMTTETQFRLKIRDHQ
jgi:hypothetical protein